MSVTFRFAKSTDVPFITRVYNQNIPKRTVTADLTPASVTDELKSFKQHNAQRPLWMIEDNGQKAGYVSLESFYGRSAYHNTVEISIYIDNQFQHRGIGTQTLKYIAEQTKRLNIHTILAFIFSVNIPSQRLFKSAGFEIYDHLPKVADMGNRIISLDILGKKY
ncbi:GNAT family N-acetyltransferase [Acetilactobacillus jinshanensis]|uniref:N-acetyltransferase family protein n=1 Tax=Acetilactobacillus jinshanensis TaxID=1720083 RepID=A0A4P6ZLM8_9LACO|nr:GNAT family N-acetyltransferase [Acetilactobacillus jinshanensis]QBP18598.1 N-acetyltransferase family protein [Acetilactobacillus jinshanensis]URL61474.1 N-acetyltransferase [uncultured bacterium]